MNNYDIEVQERFGNTDAYKEYEQKTANYSKDKWQTVNLSIKKRKAELVDSPEKFRKMHKSYRAILSDVAREFYKMF